MSGPCKPPVSDMELKHIVEAALLAAAQPLTLNELAGLFEEHERPSDKAIRAALDELALDCQSRAVELKQVASGFRLQVKAAFAPWVSRLFEERPARYSRAFLETLAIIAYRQPVTRGEIEEIRGVAVNSQIIRTLLERGWIDVVGYKEVPGRPGLLATTPAFLDYFNLSSLTDLPPLQEFINHLDATLPVPSPERPDDATTEAEPD